MPHIELLNGFEDFWDTKRVGNPYHGKLTNGSLQLPNGSTVQFNGGGECVLVALSGIAHLAQSEVDAQKGLRFDTYALLQSGLKYPGSDVVIGWTYKDTTGVAWRVYVNLVSIASLVDRRIVVTAKCLLEPSVTHTLTTLAVPSEPTSSPFSTTPEAVSNVVKLYPSPSGKKCLVHIMANVGLSALLEISLSGGSGGDGVPPSATSSVLRSGDDLRKRTDTTTFVARSYPKFTIVTEGYTQSCTVTQESGEPTLPQQRTEELEVLGGCYGDNDTPIIFTYTYERWEEIGQVTTGTPWSAFYNDKGVFGYVQRSQTYNLHCRKSITSTNGNAVSYATDLLSSWITLGSYRVPTSSTWPRWITQYAYDVNGLAPLGFSVTYENAQATSLKTPGNSEFIELFLKPVSFSMSVFGFGVPVATSQRVLQSDDRSTTYAVLDAGESLVWDVIGPKTVSSAVGFIEYVYPKQIYPVVVAHPITGEFAFGTNSGFI